MKSENGNSDSARIASSAILMMVSKAISHGCFLLIAVVLARSLEQADFGTFNQVWLINKSLMYFFALGLPVSVYYFLPRLREAKAKSFIVQTLLSLTALALPFSISTYLLAGTLAVYFHNPDLAGYLRLFAIYPLMVLPTIVTDAVLISIGRTTHAAVFEISSKIALILAVAAAAISGTSLDWIFRSLILHGLAQLLLAVWLMWQPVHRVRAHFALADLKSQITFSVPYGLSDLAGILHYQTDKLLVALYYPPAVFALYAAGAFEIPLAGVMSVPVVSVSMAEFTRRFTTGDIEGFLALWHHSLVKLALPIFAVTTFLMVFADPFVTGLFSSEYTASVRPFQIYLLLLPIVITVPGQMLASLGETKFVFKAMMASMIVNVFLGYLLIRTIGWLGPAWSLVASRYLYTMLIMFEIRSRLRVDLERLIPWKSLSQVGLVAMLAAVGAWPVAVLPVGTVFKLTVGFMIYAAIYLVGCVRTNVIARGEIDMVWAWMQGMSRSVVGRVP